LSASVPHSPSRELLHHPAQVIEITCQTIHAVHYQGVTLADVTEQRIKLRSLSILAGGFVDEYPAHLHAFQLSIRILVKRTNPYVTDPLSVHAFSQGNVYR